jgi:hypothetical protein
MSRSILLLLLALLSAPALAYLVFRLARELGFLDPSRDLEHEYRRTIAVALYALLLFLSIFLFGWGRGWPRAWIIFGVVNGLALVVFAAVGTVAGVRLWKIRHPAPPEPASSAEASDEGGPAEEPTPLPPQEPL